MIAHIIDDEDGLAVRNKINATIDRAFNYGPYDDIASALSAVVLTDRYAGLTVGILGLGEYNWLAGDLSDTGLIPKSSNGDDYKLLTLGLSDQRYSYANENVKYQDSRAGQFIENWATTANWNSNSAFQVSSGRMYGVGAGGGSATNHSFALASNETMRLVTSVNLNAGLISGGIMIGVSNNSPGAVASGAGASFKAIYFQGLDCNQMNLGTATALPNGAGNLTSGDYTVTLVVDLVNISIVAVKSDQSKEFRVKFSRAGFTIGNIGVFNSDARQLTGWSIGPLNAVKSIATTTPRAGVEGVNKTVHWTSVVVNTQACNIKIEVPTTYDSRIPMPVCICFHGNGSDENLFTDNSGARVIPDGLISAGYIIVTAAYTPQTSTWGAQQGLDVYYEAYKFVRDNYNIGNIFVYANSMGGIEALLTLAEKRIPGIVAFCATASTASLYHNYNDTATFVTIINSAYSISGGNPYATATAGHDPCLKRGDSFRRVPMLFIYALDDTIVLPSNNSVLISSIVSPYADVQIATTTTGGHSFNHSPFVSQVVNFFNTKNLA